MPMLDIEQILTGIKEETIREMTKEGTRPGAQLAWYWTYIGCLDMTQALGLINDARRQQLYREMDQFKPEYKIVAVQEVKPNPLAATEMSTEQNYNQIDGVINNVAPKPSLLATLRQCQEDAGRSQGGAAPPSPSRDPER